LQQGRIHADETSWRVAKKKSYLWVGATPDCTFFNIDPSPSALLRFINAFLGRLEEPWPQRSIQLCANQHSGHRQSYLAHIDRSLARNGAKKRGRCTFLGKTSQKEYREGFLHCGTNTKQENFLKRGYRGGQRTPSKTLERFLCSRRKRQKSVKANPWPSICWNVSQSVDLSLWRGSRTYE